MVAVAIPAHLFGLSRLSRHWAELAEVIPVYMLPFAAVVFVANLIAQICNALSFGWTPSFGVYLFGLIWYLAFAAVQFARMLFVRPSAG
jgi:hypothetical protein